MNSPRKHALVAGVAYIISFVSIPTLVLYTGVHEPNFIVGPGPDTPVLIGGVLEMVVALAGLVSAVALYPIVGVAAAVGVGDPDRAVGVLAGGVPDGAGVPAGGRGSAACRAVGEGPQPCGLEVCLLAADHADQHCPGVEQRDEPGVSSRLDGLDRCQHLAVHGRGQG